MNELNSLIDQAKFYFIILESLDKEVDKVEVDIAEHSLRNIKDCIRVEYLKLSSYRTGKESKR